MCVCVKGAGCVEWSKSQASCMALLPLPPAPSMTYILLPACPLLAAAAALARRLRFCEPTVTCTPPRSTLRCWSSWGPATSPPPTPRPLPWRTAVTTGWSGSGSRTAQAASRAVPSPPPPPHTQRSLPLCCTALPTQIPHCKAMCFLLPTNPLICPRSDPRSSSSNAPRTHALTHTYAQHAPLDSRDPHAHTPTHSHSQP